MCGRGGDEANVLCGSTAVVAHATCLGPCPIHVYPRPPAATSATGGAADAACHCCCWRLLLVCLQGVLRTLESGELQLSLRPSGLASLQLPQHQQGKEAPAAPAGSTGQPGGLAAAASAPLKVDSQAPVDLAEVLVRAANAAAAEAEASGSGRRSDPHRYAWALLKVHQLQAARRRRGRRSGSAPWLVGCMSADSMLGWLMLTTVSGQRVSHSSRLHDFDALSSR